MEDTSTTTTLKSCTIIYGIEIDNLNSFLEKFLDSPVLLIEPRPVNIDKIKKYIANKKSKNILLVSRALVKTNKVSEMILYSNEDEYWFEKEDDLSIRGINYTTKKTNVYTTSIQNLITQYSLQNIKSLIINLNVNNITDILNSLECYNHIISYIQINKTINSNSKLLLNFNKDDDTNELYNIYSHKNLHIKIPSIGMYLIYHDDIGVKKTITLVNQYQMNLIINDITDANSSSIIPYPHSVKILSELKNVNKGDLKLLYHENVLSNLELIFDNEDEDDLDIDMIIQFNTKYMVNNYTLQIMYPLKDTEMYINKTFDIIYATKKCMYMLYQILKSNYFTDYLFEKQNEKPKLFKIFAKRYFYDYISRIFDIKQLV